ncbi:hypothetical protein GCM10009839_27700 [Catenulispora yoronensis]|uniref:Uncharacterized protein n=1 Tax=Catenulispora yoronensis TaxID=450799 RepID=A0ABP5FIG7_9ACTN
MPGIWDDDQITNIIVYDITDRSDLVQLASGPSGFTDGHVVACRLPNGYSNVQVGGGQRGGYLLMFQATLNGQRVTEAWLANCTWQADYQEGTFEFVLDSPFVTGYLG